MNTPGSHTIFELLGLQIQYGDGLRFDHQTKNITLPQTYQHLPADIQVSLGLSLQHLDTAEVITRSCQVSRYQGEQLIQVAKFIYGEQQNQNKTYKTLFLDHLSHQLQGSSHFFHQFLTTILNQRNNYVNLSLQEIYDDIITKLDTYQLQHPERSTTNNTSGVESTDGRSSTDELIQQDISMGESIEGEDTGVFAYFDPKIPGKFLYRQGVYDIRDEKKLRFRRNDTKTPALANTQLSTLSTLHYQANTTGKTYAIPLPRGYQPKKWPDTVNVSRHSDGTYSFTTSSPGQITLEIAKDPSYQDKDSSVASSPIYTGTQNIGSTPTDILHRIKTNKTYNETHQKQLKDKSNTTNQYIENIINAPQIECMTANMLMVAMCRQAGYPARVVAGINGYNKGSKGYLSSNKGHARCEVYIDGKRVEMDATPYKANNEDKQQEQKSQGESIEQLASNKPTTEGEITTQEIVTSSVLSETLEGTPRVVQDAMTYIARDAQDIISHLRQVQQQRTITHMKKQLQPKRKKPRYGAEGEITVNNCTITRLAQGDPNIFKKKQKTQPQPNNKPPDTSIKDIAIAIDISGSMNSLSQDRDNPTRMDSAFLSLVLLAVICQELCIQNFSPVFFSNEVFTPSGQPFSPPRRQSIVNIMSNNITIDGEKKKIQRGNSANNEGINQALQKVSKSPKAALVVLSDGDGGSNLFFKKDQQINPTITVLGYGLGEDVCLPNGTDHQGKPISVIQRQLTTLGNNTKGFDVKEYAKLVPTLKQHLTDLMTQQFISLS